MASEKDPKWEVVDEIPGEKPSAPPKRKIGLFRRKTLWIGVGVGVALVLAFPVLRVMLQGLLRAWWIWLSVGIYWYWMRTKRARRRR